MDTRPVLTFRGRAGRMSAHATRQVDEVLPRYGVPPGPVDTVALFGRVAPTVLEIGCGHGAASIAFCQAVPERNLLAVDVHLPGLAELAARTEALGLTNLRIHRGDAVALLDHLAPGALAAVHLFFPDPWPKARHVKRRFVSAGRIEMLMSRLQPGGALHVATDRPEYAAFLAAQAGRVPGARVHPVQRPTWRPIAGFEAKGLAAGRQVVDVVVTKAAIDATA